MLEKKSIIYIIFENGLVVQGTGFGVTKEVVGEIVFNTNVVGYQETLTDPSYAGKIILMTFPLIGNYGINLDDMESANCYLEGLIVHEKSDMPNNWRCEMTLDGFLRQKRVVGVEGVDTREIMRHIRDNGSCKVFITSKSPYKFSIDELKVKFNSNSDKDIVKKITTKEKYTIENYGKDIAVIDMGLKNSILMELKNRGFQVTVYPAYTTADEILSNKHVGVFISSGAGSPENLQDIVEQIKLLAAKLPIFGIGIGYLLLAEALSAKLTRLKAGHHGSNYPIKDLSTGKVYITSQNKSFCVSELPADMEEAFVGINGKTIEGFLHKKLPIFGVSFVPETASHPCHTGFVYDRFLSLIEGGKINA